MPKLDNSRRLMSHPQWTNAVVTFPDLIREYHRTINHLEYVIESGPN